MSNVPDVRWEAGWDGHERQQLQRLRRLTLAEKLEWLEQAQILVQQLSDADRRSPADEHTSPDSARRPE